jgi:hypothetical protein
VEAAAWERSNWQSGANEAHGDDGSVGALVDTILADGNGAERQRRARHRRDSPCDVLGHVLQETTSSS